MLNEKVKNNKREKMIVAAYMYLQELRNIRNRKEDPQPVCLRQKMDILSQEILLHPHPGQKLLVIQHLPRPEWNHPTGKRQLGIVHLPSLLMKAQGTCQILQPYPTQKERERKKIRYQQYASFFCLLFFFFFGYGKPSTY